MWLAAPLLVALFALQRAGMAEDVRRVLWPLCVALLFFRLVGAAADPACARLRRVLEWRPLVRVGEISYGVYLFHPFVAHGVMAAFGVEKVTNVGVSLACVAASVAVAEISWRLIEGPLLRWKDRFAY
jgi:peptidoglycan/LPS O-acetylase OafA/YrhL